MSGQNVLLADLPEYKIWASPNLQLNYQQQNLHLSGSLLIPKARLKFVQYNKAVVSLSPDVVFVDQHKTELNFFANLNLILGDAIHLSYGGLSGLLRGQLHLQDTPGANTTALGQINLLNGLYKAYGQVLTIQAGQALFKGGDIANPDLSLKAVKVLTDVATLGGDGSAVPGYSIMTNPDGSLTVGVSITGPLSKYQVNLFSQPTGLTQADILSYLILGVPATNAGANGGALLLSAASALSGGDQGQLNPIAHLQNQLKDTLGLEVNVGQVSQYNPNTQSVAQGTALILTKALSPRLFMSYSAAMGQAMSQFKVRYQIDQHWMAQTTSSSFGNGGDIFYTINRK
jgi:translocation and assembly module TamB